MRRVRFTFLSLSVLALIACNGSGLIKRSRSAASGGGNGDACSCQQGSDDAVRVMTGVRFSWR